LKATFLGQSAWALEFPRTRVLIDPYCVSSETRAEILAFVAGGCDFILVTHGAYDHIGIAFELLELAPTACFVSEPAVIRDLAQRGLEGNRHVELIWNAETVNDGFHIRAIETRHLSAFESVGGDFITGMPLGFLVWSEDEPEIRLLHLGDTSVYSDLSLIGQLYRPTVALIGVGAAKGFLAEMTASEGAQAALWLGVDVALPMHFEADEAPAVDFCAAVDHLPRRIESWVPGLLEAFTIERRTQMRRGT
jgi:L-ascorbate metabolism protein UlaG (beta-lactamase superfamily)